MDDPGSLKLAFLFATDFGPVQFDNPKAPGYPTVEASNGAPLSRRWKSSATTGLERAPELQRLPARMTDSHVRRSIEVRVRPQGDTRLFVPVTQEDGNRAWSSPVYLFREQG